MHFELHIHGRVFKNKDFALLKQTGEMFKFYYEIYQVFESNLNCKATKITQEDYRELFLFQKRKQEEQTRKLKKQLEYEHAKKEKYQRIIKH